MKSIRLVLASLILALYWWVSPRKKPGPKRGTRKAKPDTTPSQLAEAQADVDHLAKEVVS